METTIMCGVKLIPEDEGIINSPNQNKKKAHLINIHVLDLF